MSRFDSFQNINGPRSLNRFLQVLLFAALIFGLNRLGYTHYSRVHTDGPGLSSETLSRLRQLRAEAKPKNVTFTVTFTESSSSEGEPELARHLRTLLADFEEHSKIPAGPLVTATFLDPYRHRAEVDRIMNQHELAENKFVIARCGEKHRVLTFVDLVESKENKVVGYKGEQALLTALMQVVWPQERHICFTVGHEEMGIASHDPFRGLFDVAQQINLRNLKAKDINLSLVREIPPEAAAVVIAAPRKPFTASEVDLLRRYLERAGRVIVFCDGPSPHGLDRLFSEWGFRTDDMVVVETSREHLSPGGGLLISDFGSAHPVTQILIDRKTPVFAGVSRPVRPDPSTRAPAATLTPLLRSSGQSWAEAGHREKTAWRFDRGPDLPGPLPLAVAAERRTSERLGVNLKGGRLVVFGFSDLVANYRMTNDLGNYALFHGLLQWCVEDEPDLLTPPRPVANIQLNASRDQLNVIAGLLTAVPGAVALLGLAVFWLRRS